MDDEFYERTFAGVVLVTFHVLGLRGRDVELRLQRRRLNGHCDAYPGVIAVHCGIHTGYVSVSVRVRDRPLEDWNATEWDEVMELDLEPIRDSVGVVSLSSDAPVELRDLALPNNSLVWRALVLSRGRDQSRDRDRSPSEPETTPIEEHCFVIWPAHSPTAPAIHRQTDDFGALLRSQTRDDPETPLATRAQPLESNPQPVPGEPGSVRGVGWRMPSPGDG